LLENVIPSKAKTISAYITPCSHRNNLRATGVTADEADNSFVLKRIKERGAINMGHREASVPFTFIGEDEKPQGYSVDLCHKIVDSVKEAAGRSGLKIKYGYIRVSQRV